MAFSPLYARSMESNRINPVALITGAASGIGEACARDVARRSEGGLILVDSDEAGLDRVADALANDAPERVSTLAFDVTDPDRWTQAASFIRSQYGRLDWAVVNAGEKPAAAAAETDLVDWRSMASANLLGAVQTLKSLMPLMTSNVQGGAIVVSASAAAIKADSKAGLLQVMRTAASEGAPTVRVNAIAPGGAETPNWASMPWFQELVRETGGERAALDKVATLTPPLARHEKTEKIATLIMMLLSDETPITGATLVVDGGYTL
jgi:2-keto-3-deoxy-L-fuconate dehydrogenase